MNENTVTYRSQIKKSRSISEWIRNRFFPEMRVSSPDTIDFDRLKQRGFRVVLLDIDNTIALHGSRTGDSYANNIVNRIHDAGLEPVIVSNAKIERARTFADSLGISFIAHAKKPRIEAICRDLECRSCPCCDAIMIGDQLLTDVWSAKRAGIPVILTDKRSTKELVTVRMKRPIESILILLGGRSRWNALKGHDYDRL